MADFQIGDLVIHKRVRRVGCYSSLVGTVSGLENKQNRIKVKGTDGEKHVWRKENVHNVDADMKEGNYEPA